MHPILTIAGSDCSSGAGLQADLKTFQYFHLHGLTAVTSIVSETANTVRRVDAVALDMVEDQILLLLQSFPFTVVKTGMLGSAPLVSLVASIFRKHQDVQLVVDPVMIASTGASLLEDRAVETYKTDLIPLARVITPNIPEAEILLGDKITSVGQMEIAGKTLSKTYNCAILLKGGHLGEEDCTDILVENGQLHRFTSPRLTTKASHGTGCTLAAAIASNLAFGQPLPAAVQAAKDYLNQTLANSYSFQSPTGQTIHALDQGTSPNI